MKFVKMVDDILRKYQAFDSSRAEIINLLVYHGFADLSQDKIKKRLQLALVFIQKEKRYGLFLGKNNNPSQEQTELLIKAFELDKNKANSI